jgi:hypothetical protein
MLARGAKTLVHDRCQLDFIHMVIDFFFLEYAKDLRIIVIKKKFNHTNDTLLMSVLGGLTTITRP